MMQLSMPKSTCAILATLFPPSAADVNLPGLEREVAQAIVNATHARPVHIPTLHEQRRRYGHVV